MKNTHVHVTGILGYSKPEHRHIVLQTSSSVFPKHDKSTVRINNILVIKRLNLITGRLFSHASKCFFFHLSERLSDLYVHQHENYFFYETS
jgi:hypothetical protein